MAIKYYSGINIAGNIVPSADSTYNIGAPALRFTNVYADNLYGNLTGDVTGSASLNLLKTGGTMTGTLVISTGSDNKIDLRTPSGDTSDWNYINFYGRDGARDSYIGIDADGDMKIYSDKNSYGISLYSYGLQIDSNVNIATGVLQVGSTTVIDASRNLSATEGTFSSTVNLTSGVLQMNGSTVIGNNKQISALGASFTNPVTIYDVSTSENPRLSMGRQASESINFDVGDAHAVIYFKQDTDSNADHVQYYTIDSDSTGDKKFIWQKRAADGTSATSKLILDADGLDIRDGGSLQMNSTAVIDSSRNITAGTISGTTATFGQVRTYNDTQTDRRFTINQNSGEYPRIYNYDEGDQTFHSIKIGGGNNETSGIVVDGSGNVTIYGTLDVSGTIDLSNANLDIGAADIVFDIDSATAGARGLIWDFDGDGNGISSYIGYIRAGGLAGEKMQFNMNSEGSVTGSGTIYQFMNGGTDILTIGADGTTNFTRNINVRKVNVGIITTYSSASIEDTDAQLDIISSSSGTWGSAINLVEGASTTANTDVWSIARHTTGGLGDSGLYFNFGTGNQHDNTNRVKFSSSGDITAQGTINADNLTLTGALKGPSTFYIDPSPDDTGEPGGATTDTGTVVILGDLQVTGTTTTIDSTTLNVGDKNIVLAKDATTAAEADGAGITINGANATMTYSSTTNKISFNKEIASSTHVTSGANVYSGTGGQFRNYGGVWKATTGVSGNGFGFISADGTAMTISSTGFVDINDGLLVNGGGSNFSNIRIEAANASVYYKDSDATNAWHLGHNNPYFYLLEDTDRDGNYNTINARWDSGGYEQYTGSIDVRVGSYQIAGTTVIDSSRNIAAAEGTFSNEVNSDVLRSYTNTVYHLTPNSTSNLNGLTVNGNLELNQLTNNTTATYVLVNSGSGVVAQRQLGSAAFSNASSIVTNDGNTYSSGFSGDLDTVTGFRLLRVTGFTGTDHRAFTTHHNLINLPNTGSTSYEAQIAINTGTTGIAFRSSSNGTFTDWYNIYHSGTQTITAQTFTTSFPGGYSSSIGNYFNAFQIRAASGASVQIGGNGTGWVNNNLKVGNGNLEVVGNIDGEIFRDIDNTSYYVDPANTSTSANFAGKVQASQVGVTNIVTNRVVKFNGSILDDSIITDDGTFIDVAGKVQADNAFIVQGIDTSNSLPSADHAVLSGYGLIGNRGTFYITNPYTVQIGTGVSHNNDPAALFTSSSITLKKETTVENFLTISRGADKKIRFSDTRTGANTFSIEHDASQIYLYNETTASSLLEIENNGNIGVGLSPIYKFDVNGTLGVRSGQIQTNGSTASFNFLAGGTAKGAKVAFLLASSSYSATPSTGQIWATDSMQSPIYYDYNNTSYYVNPNADSSFGGSLGLVGDLDLALGSYITFYGNGSGDHGITSRNHLGNATDDLRINSYGAVYINLDSNNNNTSTASFEIGRHGSTGTISDWLFKVDGETGATDISGDVTINPSTNYALYIGRMPGQPNIKSSDAYAFMDSNGGWAGLNWYSSDNVALANGGGSVSIGNSGISQKLTVWGSVGATIYYDKDNTAYYVNPNGNSILNTISAFGASVNTLAVSGNATVGGTLDVNGTVEHGGLVMTSGNNVDQTYQAGMSFTLTADTWTDTGINGTNLATGTYVVQVFVDDHNAGGGHYDEYYSGTMSWYASQTNSSNVDEIVLHNAGHASNSSYIQLRTQRHPVADGSDLMLQVKQNFTHTTALDGTNGKTMTFKFRRLL